VRRFGALGTIAIAIVVLAASPSFGQVGVSGKTTADSFVAPASEVSSGTGQPGPIGIGPGTASEPVHAPAAEASALAADAAEDVAGYRTSGVPIVALTPGSRPYDDWPVVPRDGYGLVDDDGVRMFRVAGDTRLWNHPVAQAQYALQNLNSYRLTDDPAYLDRAIANAQRLVDTRVESAGGWFFPYDFDWSFYGDTTCHGPWYSAMAQGQALSTFVRLYQVTGDDAWRAAADATFNTLVQAPVANTPFASWVDSDQHLWLEEYPQPDIVSSEKVLNGHIFAIFGLADYWGLTHDPRAAQLYDGAVTTVQDTMLTVFRQPAWSSYYSMRHRQVNTSYHKVHVHEFLDLFQLTHRARFVAAANTYRADYPLTATAGQAILTRKLKRVYLVKRGTVVGDKAVELRHRVSVSVDSRQRTHGHGIMLRISSGKYAGWYAREAYGRAWMTQPTDEHRYTPRHVGIQFQPGTYVGYRYSSLGHRIATKTVQFARASAAPSGRSAIVGGQSAFEFTTGTWAGY
jgi:hypothetical protein